MGTTLSKCAGGSEKRKPETNTTQSTLDSGAGRKPSMFGRKSAYHSFGYDCNFSKCYKVGKELGRGQFGTTYMCTELSTGKKFAVKIIKKKNLTDDQAISDVVNEVNILKVLKGKPHVVEIFGVYEDHDSVYIVLELCTGGELFQQLSQKGKYTEADAAAIMRQVLQVVADCHINGVIHRDLKPENFLFNNTTESAVLKVTDFGLSDFFKPETVFKDVAGSAYYVAPEVLRKRYGPAADLWSCGVILYLLLSGNVPFYHKTETGIFKQVLSGRISFASAPWPNISEPAKQLIVLLLDRDPKLRPSASAALDHGWIKVNGSASDSPLDINMVFNMQRFVGFHKAKQAILVRVANQLTHKELEHMREQFLQLDVDASGTVTIDELVSTLSTFRTGESGKAQFSQQNLDDLMSAMDVDRSRSVDYMEFVAAAMSTHQMSRATSSELWHKRMRRVFDEIDRDCNGFIDRSELKAFVGPSSDVSCLLHEADTNNDGVIDYEEFKSMLLNTSVPSKKMGIDLPGQDGMHAIVAHPNTVQ